MRSPALVGLTVLATACSSPDLTATGGAVSVRPTSLDLGSAFIGYPVRRTLTIENTSPADVTLQIATTAPFSAPASIALGGGEELELSVTFAPQAAGDAAGTLTIAGNGAHLVASLHGLGQSPPSCAAPPPCESVVFDADAGSCVTSLARDGADCSSGALCLDHPTCQGGSCQGPEKSCDDSNACTTDGCSPSVGCTHQAVTCPAPSDPCQAAVCDPSSGCSSAPAPDGTVCGSVDCATAHICLLGSCQAVTPPDGTECSPASACRGEGTCQGGDCVIPDAGMLVPVWSYTPDGGAELGFNGTIDSNGDLYWTECGDACLLVSATRDGYPRYRVPTAGSVPIGSFSDSPASLFGLFETVIVFATIDGSVEAHDSESGALLWSETMSALLGDGGSSASWGVTGLVGSSAGQVEVSAELNSESGSGPFVAEAALLQLSLADGHPVASQTYPGIIGGPIEDASGGLWANANVFIDGGDGGAGEESSGVVLFAADGGGAFDSNDSNDQPLAAYGGWVFVDQPGVVLPLPAPDGGDPTGPLVEQVGPARLFPVAFGYGAEVAPPVFDGTLGFVFSNDWEGCGFGPCDTVGSSNAQAAGFDPDAGALTWVVPMPVDSWLGFYAPLLTNRATVLVVVASMPVFEGDPRAQDALTVTSPSLLEIDGQGDVLSTCTLPPGDDYGTGPVGTALHAGRWFVARYAGGPGISIEAFDVPGADMDPHGWVCAGGNPAHTGQPW